MRGLSSDERFRRRLPVQAWARLSFLFCPFVLTIGMSFIQSCTGTFPSREKQEAFPKEGVLLAGERDESFVRF